MTAADNGSRGGNGAVAIITASMDVLPQTPQLDVV
jgi:hypothetical protein